MTLPDAILFDLDDTLLTAYRQPERTWFAIISEHAEALGEHDSRWVTTEVLDRVLNFLSAEEGRKLWRLEGDATRRLVVRSAFHRLNLDRPIGSEALHGVDADRIADRFETYLEETIRLKPDADKVLQNLQGRGIRLGLLTNGSTLRQRDKIARFHLARYFDAIQIEEEAGIGKPEPAAYLQILTSLNCAVERAWMIGDDPIWDVTVPAEIGLTTWHYAEEKSPLPEGAKGQISALQQIPELLAG